MTGKKTRYTLLIAMSLMLNSTTTWATTSDLSLLVGNCESCHGPKGSSLGPATPTIAGMAEDTFIEAMENYQQDERPSTIMGRIAKGYSKEDFKQMATYFRKQPFIRYPQEVDASKVQPGQKLHDEYCEKCHEDNGFTDEDGSSILAGQWLPYLQFNLADFKAGNREMPKKMKKRLEKMLQEHGEKSLEEIAHFYSSQTEMKK